MAKYSRKFESKKKKRKSPWLVHQQRLGRQGCRSQHASTNGDVVMTSPSTTGPRQHPPPAPPARSNVRGARMSIKRHAKRSLFCKQRVSSPDCPAPAAVDNEGSGERAPCDEPRAADETVHHSPGATTPRRVPPKIHTARRIAVRRRRKAQQSTEPVELEGRRICQISYYNEQIRTLNAHSENAPFNCNFNDMACISESHHGLLTCWTYRCKMCRFEKKIWSEPPTKMNSFSVKHAATAGTVLTGGGHRQLEELLSCLNMPCMSAKTFTKCEEELFGGWFESALEQMKMGVAAEVEEARRLGHIHPDGTPLLTVTVDGSWPKRSSKHKYSSLSGMAAIVGVYSQKVLFFGIRNKFCVRCQRARNKKLAVEDHRCFVNWKGSATAMEADIILEGFRLSEEMHGVRYKWFVGDGDSSTNKKILDEAPYANCQVEKIECSNHLLRNFCYNMEEIVSKGDNHRQLKRGETKGLRCNISSKIMTMRNAVVKASQHWLNADGSMGDRVLKLKQDILNCPSHIFGNHSKCASYFCSGHKSGETNLVPELVNSGLWAEVMSVCNRLADHSRSLIHCMTNNAVENLNGIICKFIGGKRLNFTQRGSYQMRVTAAVVAKNSGKPFREVHKKLCNNQSPGKFAVRFESDSVRRRAYDKRRLATLKRLKSRGSGRDQHYGAARQRVNRVKEDVLRELNDDVKKRVEIERETRGQSASHYWRRLRLYRLTASNFGKVCKRGLILCDSLVKSILYKDFPGNEHTNHGKIFEEIAIQEYCRDHGVKVFKSGLFIDRELPFLAASPDGVLEDGLGLVEVKCPSVLKHLTVEEAIKRKCDLAFKIDKRSGEIVLDKNHDHFYQMQGQMHIAEKTYCIYIVKTEKNYKIWKVERDDLFWVQKMEKQLTKFYFDCLLVEIIEQNYLLGKPIRNPDYLIRAVKESSSRKRVAKAVETSKRVLVAQSGGEGCKRNSQHPSHSPSPSPSGRDLPPSPATALSTSTCTSQKYWPISRRKCMWFSTPECKLLVAKVPGDGACLFGAVAHQLFGNFPGSEAHQRETREVRSAVVQYIGSNFDFFEPFLLGILLQRGERYRRYLNKENAAVLHPREAFAKFLSDLEKSDFHGCSESLLAVPNIYSVTVVCHQPEAQITKFEPLNCRPIKQIHVLFRQRAQHYDSVVQIGSVTVNSFKLDRL